MPQAEYAIAGCYADGEGVPQDNIEAYKWISLAESHGVTNATIFKNALWKKLSPEQQAKAQKVVDKLLEEKKK